MTTMKQMVKRTVHTVAEETAVKNQLFKELNDDGNLFIFKWFYFISFSNL